MQAEGLLRSSRPTQGKPVHRVWHVSRDAPSSTSAASRRRGTGRTRSVDTRRTSRASWLAWRAGARGSTVAKSVTGVAHSVCINGGGLGTPLMAHKEKPRYSGLSVSGVAARAKHERR